MTTPWEETRPLRHVPANPFMRATLPLPELRPAPPGTWCAACLAEVGFLSHEHYRNFCSVTRAESEYHFCCPGRCQLAAP